MAATPILSVIMANRNGAPYVREALGSVLGQTLRRIEVIFSDDASTDESVAIAGAVAETDPRLKVLTERQAGGPAAARNRALAVAQGKWIAIVDSDDLIHPARFERMLTQAERLDADVVADDQVYFGANEGRTLLEMRRGETPWHLSVQDFLAAETASPALPVGYLKPVIRRSALGRLRYDETMTVGEDFDLLFRLLLAGARMAVLPKAYYLYRRHPGSISHRLTPRACEGMIRAGERYLNLVPSELAPLVRKRIKTHVRARDFALLVQDLKSGRYPSVIKTIFFSPSILRPLAGSLRERLTRRSGVHAMMPAEDSLDLIARGPSVHEYGSGYLRVPADETGWTPANVAALVSKTGCGRVRLRAHGRAGLEALGYVPGWKSVELIPPESGWSDEERERIAAFPWPVAGA